MVGMAMRVTNHVRAWVIWHSTHVSVLDELEAPRPPQAEAAEQAA
jgi:hypothetical protein